MGSFVLYKWNIDTDIDDKSEKIIGDIYLHKI